jgi:hypothetical protein
VLAAGCDGIGGDYLSTWPSVFHANMVLHDRDDERVIVGVSFRSAPWQDRWAADRQPDGLRLAVLPDQEATAIREAARFGLAPVGPPERRGRVLVLTFRPTTAAPP